MKALVTGSAGFIGNRLLATLRAQGHSAVGLDRRTGPGVDINCDLAAARLDDVLSPYLDEVDVVFHLAARPGVRDRGEGIDEARRRDNVVATQRLFAALPVHIPIVATSSSSVYGGVVARKGCSYRPSNEDDPLRPRGGYAASKVAMEGVCAQRRADGGTVTVLRPFTVVGEHQRSDMALARWATALEAGEPIRIFGSPHRMRDLTDVREVVAAFIRAAEVGYNGVVNVGTGVGHTLSDMAEAMVSVSGLIAEVIVDEALPEEAEATLADTTRCERVLGFVPTTRLEDVARRVWESYVGDSVVLAGSVAR